MIVHNGSSQNSLKELTLFPFDEHSLPFQNGVELHLAGHRSPAGKTRIVLSPGQEGAPDCKAVMYYGTVLQVGDELWMWYLGQGSDEPWCQRVCLATSRDGYHWEKPSLGLVEYFGSTANNLVDLNQELHGVQACVVFDDPDDPDPSRRYKMAFESKVKYGGRFAVAYSADGLRWCESPNNPVGGGLEMAGGTRFNGTYYLSGHGANLAGPLRQFVTHISYDFEHWSEAACRSLQRGTRPQPDWAPNSGEQVHLGAGLWNRGNVIIGFYGQWHGHPTNDRRLVTMDLGLAVSSDGLHYREPIPGYPIVAAAEDGFAKLPEGHTYVNFPALMQGQGFENIGEETLFWYAPWPEQSSNGVRVARWRRDRLGYFQAFLQRGQQPQGGCHIVSAAIDLQGQVARAYLNVDGIDAHSSICVEVLDEQFRPLAGYTKEDAISPASGGLRQMLQWRQTDSLVAATKPIRLRISFGGIRPEDIRLYAVYLEAVR